MSRKMAYPCRYSDLIPQFGRPVPGLSMICNCVTDYIYDSHVHRLTSWNPQLLDPASLQMYCDAISRNCSPLDNCFGFIDGTVRPVCRPGEKQRVLYNGHKRVHALKFQSVVLPSGMIAHTYGPVGKLNDELQTVNKQQDSAQVQMYGVTRRAILKGGDQRKSSLKLIQCLHCSMID